MPTPHGGPRLCCAIAQVGAGKQACYCSNAVTCRRPTLQHGHKFTSILTTRAMNPCADSMAWGLAAGICKASLAALSLTRCSLMPAAHSGEYV